MILRVNKDKIKKENLSKNILDALLYIPRQIVEIPNTDFRIIFALIKKELRSQIYNPASYIVLIVFLIALNIFFFSDFFIVNRATMAGMFDMMPWILLILLPALTMGLYATERKEGTIEYLLTQPIKISQLIITKYISVVLFATFGLLLTLPLTIAVGSFGDLNWGIIAGEYIASFFLILGLAGVGSVISSIFKNQIAAFLSTLLISFLFIFAGSELIARNLSYDLVPILENISLLSHYLDMSRGAIDLRDILYFAGFVLLSLALTRTIIIGIKYPVTHRVTRMSQITLIFIAAFAIGISYLGSIVPGRLDLTENKLYTISDATHNVLDNMGAAAELNLYVSEKLPTQFQPQLRELKYLLTEYDRIGGSKVKVNYNYIGNDQADVEEATTAGIQQVQFNLFEGNDIQLKTGFLGVQVIYAKGEESEKTEAIPFVEDTGEIEYDLTSIIYQLSDIQKPNIGVLEDDVEYTISSGYSSFYQELSKQFNVVQYSFNNEENNQVELSELDLLIVPGASSPSKEQEDPEQDEEDTEETPEPDEPETPPNDFNKDNLLEYFKGGGNILLMDTPINVNIAETGIDLGEKESSLSGLFEEFGVRVNTDLVYDVASNENVGTSEGIFRTFLPYPLWPLLVPSDENSQYTNDIQNILTPWPSSIRVDDELPENVTVRGILSTTEFGFSQAGTLNIDINQDFEDNENNLSSVPIMVELEVAGDENQSKALIVGNSKLFEDQFISYQQNLGFGLRAVELLTQDTSLSDIKIKDRTPARLEQMSDSDKNLLKFGIPGGTIIGVVVLAGGVFWYRRRTKAKFYTKKITA